MNLKSRIRLEVKRGGLILGYDSQRGDMQTVRASETTPFSRNQHDDGRLGGVMTRGSDGHHA